MRFRSLAARSLPANETPIGRQGLLTCGKAAAAFCSSRGLTTAPLHSTTTTPAPAPASIPAPSDVYTRHHHRRGATPGAWVCGGLQAGRPADSKRGGKQRWPGIRGGCACVDSRVPNHDDAPGPEKVASQHRLQGAHLVPSHQRCLFHPIPLHGPRTGEQRSWSASPALSTSSISSPSMSHRDPPKALAGR